MRWYRSGRLPDQGPSIYSGISMIPPGIWQASPAFTEDRYMRAKRTPENTICTTYPPANVMPDGGISRTTTDEHHTSVRLNERTVAASEARRAFKTNTSVDNDVQKMYKKIQKICNI